MNCINHCDEEIDPFPYIQTNTGFSDFFHTIFKSGRFPRYSEYNERELPSYFERFSFIEDFGYYLPCMDVVDYIKNMDIQWVSVGCGRGYFEKILQLHGVDIIPTDISRVDENLYFRGDLHRRTPMKKLHFYVDTFLLHLMQTIIQYQYTEFCDAIHHGNINFHQQLIYQ
jgi:hypothetical protein